MGVGVDRRPNTIKTYIIILHLDYLISSLDSGDDELLISVIILWLNVCYCHAELAVPLTLGREPISNNAPHRDWGQGRLLTKIQIPLALELYQTFTEYDLIDLSLLLIRSIRYQDRLTESRDRLITERRLIRVIYDCKVGSEASTGINEHLTGRILILFI